MSASGSEPNSKPASRQGSTSSLKGGLRRQGDGEVGDGVSSNGDENATVLKRVDLARKGGKLDLTNL
eukprot:1932118-Rhodomonas_salina.1